MQESSVVVISVKELYEVARVNDYGFIKCHWTAEDFEKNGAFEVNKKELTEYLETHPNDSWCKTCLKVMEEEQESVLFIVDEHKEDLLDYRKTPHLHIFE